MSARIALCLSAVAGVKVRAALTESQYGDQCTLAADKVTELKNAFITLMRETPEDVLSQIFRKEQVPTAKIDAAAIEGIISAHQDGVFRKLQLSGERWGAFVRESATNSVLPPGGPANVAYGRASVKKVIELEQSRAGNFFEPEHMAQMQEALNADAVIQEALDVPVGQKPPRGYLAAHPIYALSPSGISYVDGVEVLFRGGAGDHAAPNLWGNGAYQLKAIADDNPIPELPNQQTHWAQYQLAWARLMGHRLNNRVNFISINFRLKELEIPGVQRLIVAAHQDFMDAGLSPELVIEITEYDEYKEAVHLPIIKDLLEKEVHLALDDLMPGHGTVCPADVAQYMKEKGMFFHMEPKEGAVHATTYANAMSISGEGEVIGTQKLDSKHAQKVFGTEMKSWSFWTPVHTPTGPKLDVAKAAGGLWTVAGQSAHVNPNCRTDNAASVFVNEKGQIVGADAEGEKTLVVQSGSSGLDGELGRNFAKAKFLDYVVGTLQRAIANLQKGIPQRLRRFVIEVSIDDEVIAANPWFAEMLDAAKDRGLSIFSTQGGPTNDFGVPVDCFDVAEGKPTLAITA